MVFDKVWVNEKYVNCGFIYLNPDPVHLFFISLTRLPSHSHTRWSHAHARYLQQLINEEKKTHVLKKLQTNAKVEGGRNHLRAERAQSRLQTKFNKKRARAHASVELKMELKFADHGLWGSFLFMMIQLTKCKEQPSNLLAFCGIFAEIMDIFFILFTFHVL